MKMNREMFEDKDYPTQWALNPTIYQNMSNDQVDWAALAQQWIKMKETVVPPAPPPPSLTADSNSDDGGEAPMDVDTKDDEVPPAPPAPNISGNDNWSQWSQWGQWNTSAPGGGCWEWSGVPPPGVTMGPDGKPTGIPGVPAVPAVPVVPPAPNISSRSGFNVPPPSAPYSYNSITSTTSSFNQMPGYWSSDPTSTIPSPTSSPFIKGIRHSPRMTHMRNDLMRVRDNKEKTPDDDQNMVIDAAKRRQLPAWIREGLEKMEREKHKAVERERQEMLRKQELQARKQAEDEARAVLDPAKSKFDSDSEKEIEPDFDDRGQDDDRPTVETSPDIVRPRKSRFRDADMLGSRVSSNDSPILSGSITGSTVKRSREEVLQDVMLKVRRSLTEILLEVTNEEIASICREVWNRYRAKAPAGEPPVASFTNTAPLAQITRKLGLGIYGDSNSESEEEQEFQQSDDDDSDLDLKETLRRRQVAFKKTEEEIEARLAEEEENELCENEEHNSGKYENHSGNDNTKSSGTVVNDKEIINERDESETQSSGGHTPKHQNQLSENQRTNPSSPSQSVDSDSSTNESSSSTSSDSTSSDSSRNVKKRRRKKSKSRSRSRTRKSRSSSRTRDKRSRRKRSRSSSHKSGKKRSKDRKRYSRSSSRSRSRKRSRSHSRRSRDRRRSRSRSRTRKRERSSRSYSRERRRSRSYGHSTLKRRSRTKSKERSRRSISKSRSHRDGKKSAHRYKD